jgi:hypothetical protein
VSGSTPAGGVPKGEALPERGGPGEGAGAAALALEAPTKVVCKDLAYRSNIKTAGRTQYYVIRADTWEILRPTRVERSRTKAHGRDIYCLPKEVWDKTITVLLERSNSGKLHYEVLIPHVAFEKYKLELEALLALAGDFEDMEEIVKKYTAMRKLAGG